jgi:hypothetical protein
MMVAGAAAERRPLVCSNDLAKVTHHAQATPQKLTPQMQGCAHSLQQKCRFEVVSGAASPTMIACIPAAANMAITQTDK